MTMDRYAVIMAGGGGTRLWPLSRKARPKQVLGLLEDRSLFRITLDRLLPEIPPDHIFVVTVAEQAEILRAQAPELPDENFVLEPLPKGTASVVGLAATILKTRGADSLMACLPADHLIEGEDEFRRLLGAAFEVAQDDFLVTLGIQPSYPATGYGYIRRGRPIRQYAEIEAFQVEAFVEKPDLDQARAYLQSGEYSWNSGMFIWKVEPILGEIQRLMPDLAIGLEKIADALQSPEYSRVLQEVWESLTPQTIDYGVMENAERVAVLPARDFGWIDIGGWSRLAELGGQDRDGNVIRALSTLLRDSENNLIFQKVGAEEGRLISLLGVDNLVVVDTDDVLLICDLARAEEVKRLVEDLEDSGLDQYL